MFNERIGLCDSVIQFCEPTPRLQAISLCRISAQRCLCFGFGFVGTTSTDSSVFANLTAMRAVLLLIARWTKGSLYFLDADKQLRRTYHDHIIAGTPSWLSGLDLKVSSSPPLADLHCLINRFRGRAYLEDCWLDSDIPLAISLAELVSLAVWATGGSIPQAARLGDHVINRLVKLENRQLASKQACFTKAFNLAGDGIHIPTVIIPGAERAD